MSFQLLLVTIIGIILAAGIATTFLKATSRPFASDPGGYSYHGESIRQEASRRAEDTAERQRRMMERTKERMERNKF